MSEKHYPYYGGAFDRIVFDKDGSVWVPESEISKLRDLERENANLKERIIELEYERMMMFLELAGQWIRVKQREMEEG
jgi:hypothetical protein